MYNYAGVFISSRKYQCNSCEIKPDIPEVSGYSKLHVLETKGALNSNLLVQCLKG